MVSGVLPGDDDGKADPVPDRDVDALDSHRSYTVNQGMRFKGRDSFVTEFALHRMSSDMHSLAYIECHFTYLHRN